MKKTARFLALLLTLLLCMSLLPMTAFAADGDLAEIWVGGVQMKMGYYLPTGNDTTADSLTATKPMGGYAYLSEDGNTLTLHNYSYSGDGYYVARIDDYFGIRMEPENMTLKLEGNNSISCREYAVGAINNLTIEGRSELDTFTVTATSMGIYAFRILDIKNSQLTQQPSAAYIQCNSPASLTAISQQWAVLSV